jgi:hypothetical protein
VKWATRRGCHVDRAACAWVIRRFIDPDATFVFVDDPDEVPADATAFDMRGAALSHHGGRCSFETVLEHHALVDPALAEVGRIVHQADLRDDQFDAPEAAGLDALVRGLSMTLDDEALLQVTGPLFDGLYAFKQRARMLGREPA